jgi:ComF family protein
MLRRSRSLLLSLLLPGRCALCGMAEEHAPLCAACRNLLPFADQACDRCASPVPAQLPNGIHCARCQRDPPPFYRAAAALHYAFPVDSAVKAFKFKAQLCYAPAFASLLSPLLQSRFPDADALIPVPLHRWRHAYRGFNQATEICRLLARKNAMPMICPVARVRATRSQSGLDALARRRNLHNAFVVRGELQCRHPVIVDDVMTTGETCRQLARALLDAGAESVGVLVLARA